MPYLHTHGQTVKRPQAPGPRPQAPGPCLTEGCRKSAAPGHRYCNPCRYQREKAADPERVAYTHLKANVATRNKRRAAAGRPPIKFCLTLEQFRAWATPHQYMLGKGRRGHSYHIDRINDSDAGPGYCLGNIQVLTNRENVQKENLKRTLPKHSLQYCYLSREAWWHRHGGHGVTPEMYPF